jgi:hypothetical protein
MPWYNRGKFAVMNGTVDLLADTIKVMLVNASASFNADHNFVSEVNANELSGTGYVGGFNGAGRQTLGSKAINEDDTNDRAEFDAADVTWTGINAGTASAAILIKEGTADTDSLLVAYLDFTDVVTNGGNLTLQWDAEGILQIS